MLAVRLILASISLLLAVLPMTTAVADDAATLAKLEAWYGVRVKDTDQEAQRAGTQYMRQNCHGLAVPYGSWSGYPVERCDYSEKQYAGTPNEATVRTFAYLLFPTAHQLAEWSLNACIDAHATNREDCAGKVADTVWRASNAQFAVAGYVTENAEVLDHPDNPLRPYCFQFRDGVAVKTASWTTQMMNSHQACGPDHPEDVLTEPVLSTFLYARVSSTSREQYTAAEHAMRTPDRWQSGRFKPSDKDHPDTKWQEVVGEEFRAAWNSDRNFLIYATARSGFDSCTINVLATQTRPPGCK